MACGLPSVVFDTGGIPELIEHMRNGYIARYKDIDDLLTGTNFLINNKDFRKMAGEQARKSVEQNFTIQKMTDAYLNLYYKVIKKRSGQPVADSDSSKI
jgi:glycosyltransferase involved in cell wall biosynthesis